MPISDLNENERKVVKECLRAAVEGPFFPEWEFATLFGLSREDVKRVLVSWPDVNEADESVVLAINNGFNNLLGYPLPEVEDLWGQFISVTPMELARVFDKWKGRAARA